MIELLKLPVLTIVFILCLLISAPHRQVNNTTGIPPVVEKEIKLPSEATIIDCQRVSCFYHPIEWREINR